MPKKTIAELETKIEALQKTVYQLQTMLAKAEREQEEASLAYGRERVLTDRLLTIMEHAAQEGNFPRRGIS